MSGAKLEKRVADLEFQLVEATRMVLKLASTLYDGDTDDPWAYAPETGEWGPVSERDPDALTDEMGIAFKWIDMRREQNALVKGGRHA